MSQYDGATNQVDSWNMGEWYSVREFATVQEQSLWLQSWVDITLLTMRHSGSKIDQQEQRLEYLRRRRY